MADKVILMGIECYAHGGVTPAEREIGQRYRIDVELTTDVSRAAGSDSVDDAVHYGLVHDAVVGAMRDRPFNLIEAAAERVARRILDEFTVDAVTLRLQKLLPPIDGVVAAAAVEITRTRGA